MRGAPDEAKAKQALDLLTAQYPRDFAAKNNLGIYFGGKGQLDEAAAQYRAAHELAPSEPLPLTNLSGTLFSLGQYDEAMKFADLAMSIRPSGGTATSRWVRAHIQFDPREAALKGAAVKYAPAESVLQTEMAMAIWDGRMADYLASYRKLLESFRSARPEAVAGTEMNHAINRAVFEGGTALEALKKRVAAPEAPRGFVLQTAIVSAVMGDPSVLRREISRIERENAPAAGASPSESLVVARAYLLSADGKTDAAVAALQAIVSRDPRRASTHFSIGQVQERGGLIDDAIASYRRVVDAGPALAMNNNLPLARMALGQLLLKKGDAATANAQLDVLRKQWAHADASFLPAQELKRIAK
jgi:tetratricopeptide (TPR) repeat protein